MSVEDEAKIESQKIIGEAKPGSYRPIRFTRVKYKDNPDPLIDIRVFQRGYNESGEEQFYPTKTGIRFLEDEFQRVIKEYTLMPKSYIHPLIYTKSFPLLRQGEYESAVLTAFKLIETSIRKKINANAEDVGVQLIRKAFNADNGPLADKSIPKAEQEAFAHYIAGAFGFYKNPCSHREVNMDFIEAFDRIVVASDLLKTVEKASGQ